MATRPLGRFFVRAFGFAWLTWLPIILGTDGLAILPVHVPASLALLGTFTGPMLAAFLACAGPERRALIRSMFTIRRPVWVYGVSLLILPLAVAAATAAWCGQCTPISRWSLYFSDFLPFVLFGSVAGPLGEESGWRGYALPRLVLRFGPVRAALLLGVIWSLWHLPMVFFVPPYRGGVPPWTLMAALVPSACGLSLFMAWLYYASGQSVFAAVVAHAAWNAAVAVQQQLATIGDRRPSLLSAAAFLAAVALVASRGRLGVQMIAAEQPHAADGRRDSHERYADRC